MEKIIYIVSRPKYSNVRGGLRLRAEMQDNGLWLAGVPGHKRLVLEIDPRDVNGVATKQTKS